MVTSYVRRDDLRIYPGDDREFTWPVTDDAGAPLDLTGWSARAQVRTLLDDQLLHEWSIGAGNLVLANSTLTLRVADSETWGWTAGRFDIHLVDPSDRVQVLAHGSIVLDRGVTRG